MRRNASSASNVSPRTSGPMWRRSFWRTSRAVVEKLGDRNVERDRDPVVGLDDDAHVSAAFLPSLAGPVDVPAPVHPHVRAQMQAAGEIDDEMFADGNDLLDRSPGDRLLIVDARQLREHGLEPPHGLSGERGVQCARGAEDRIALRHDAILSSAHPQRRPQLVPHRRQHESCFGQERRERALRRRLIVDLGDEERAPAAGADDRRQCRRDLARDATCATARRREGKRRAVSRRARRTRTARR